MNPTEPYLELCKAQVRIAKRDRVPDHRTLNVIATNIGQALVEEELTKEESCHQQQLTN